MRISEGENERHAGIAYLIQSSASDGVHALAEVARRTPDTAPFLRLARLAAALLDVPTGAVTLIDSRGDLVIAREGQDLGMLPFCRAVAAAGHPLILRDTRDGRDGRDARATATGMPPPPDPSAPPEPTQPLDPSAPPDPRLRAYAGVPILAGDGTCLGAICGASETPRDWAGDAVARLEDLAALAVAELERVRAAAELHLAWEHYSALLEHNPDIAWTKDLRLRYTACNRAMAEDMGVPVEEIVGATAGDLFPPDVARALERNDRHVLATGRPLVTEEHIPVDGGGMRIIDTSKAPLRDAGGAVVGLVGIARDVTARRTAEETLRQSERRYRSLFEDVPVGLYRTRADGEILAVNLALAEMLGYDDPDELQGGRFSSEFYVDPEDRERWREIVHRDGQVRGYEMRHRTVDGRQIWVRFNGRVERDENGEILYYEGAIEDITQRREAEEARRDAEARARNAASTLRMTLEAAPIGIAVLDARGRVENWNSAAGRILGVREADVIGRPFPGVAADRFEAFRERLRAVLEEESVVRIESVLEPEDGSPLHAWISLGPLPSTEDGERRVVAILADVTEQKELEEQLRQAQKMEAVGRLAGGIAHDFNNVLTAIGGHVQLLLDDMHDGHDFYEDLLEVRQGAVRAAALTRQLLAFSRQQVLRPEVVDLADALRTLEPMLRRLIRENIELVIDPADGCHVRIDPNQFEQIIMNLVVNAKDAIEADGRISVSVARVEVEEGAEQPVRMSHGDYIRLSVADTGCGMDATTLSRIFEPFFTTKEPGKGTGLGLSTVYGTVKQSGGFIWADSEPGGGTVFDILLPLTDGTVSVAVDRGPERSDGADGVDRALTALPGETILLVEDEASVRELARRVLVRRGYRVLAAESPGEALRAAAAAGRIDLLVSDVVMPEMSGRDLAVRLRELRPGLPTLLMSGYTADEVIRTDAGAPGAAFLEKPFTPAQLLAAVAGMLRAR